MDRRPAGDERALLGAAGVVLALASGGAAMAAAAGDAMFLSRIGVGPLGVAVAASNALLALVLAIVGGLADRLERRRVLASLAMISAAVLVGLAGLSMIAPRAAAACTLIGGKQLAAATDLAFWVVIAERLDARKSQRLLPVLAATGGIGAAAGAGLVALFAGAIGARGVLVIGAALLALAAVGAARLPATRRVAAPVAIRGATGRMIRRAWRDGARAVRGHPLARQLAIVVGAAGVFASLAYFALGVAVAGHGSTAELARLLGAVRGTGQLVTLIVQLVVAPRLLARLGTGGALLLAPAFALAAALGLVIAPVLAMAVATQMSARVLDAGIETPAEKLAQTLLPGAIRGRVGGFLDGTAKRAGAVLGGLIAAGLAGMPRGFYAVTAGFAVLWAIAAARTSRALPALAVAHVVEDARDDAVVDARAVEAVIGELAGGRVAARRAAELLARLHGRGQLPAGIDVVAPLVAAAVTQGAWRALIAVLDVPAPAHGPAIAAALPSAPPLALRALGLAGGVAPETVLDESLVGEIARLRLAGADVLGTLRDAVRDGEAAALDELTVELARAGDWPAVARVMIRALRRPGEPASRAAAFAALARRIQHSRDQRSAELSLLRAELLELSREQVDAGHEPAAAVSLLGALLDATSDLDPRDATRGGVNPAAPPTDRGSLTASDWRGEGPVWDPRDATRGGVNPAAPPTDRGSLTASDWRGEGPVWDPRDATRGGVNPAAPPTERGREGPLWIDDLRRISRALGEADDDVRAAAEAALAALGPAATGELIATAAWGRRRARDRAAALLADQPVTAVAIDRLVDAELTALDRTHATIAALTAADDALVVRRLDERLAEIAHTVLLLVAARRRSPAIARAAVAWRHARGRLERARTLAVIDAALPRALVGRLVDAVDQLTPAERARAIARAGQPVPSRDAALRGELTGRDRLARALVLHALDAGGRSAHRDAIAAAARAEAIAASPRALIAKLARAMDAPADAADNPGDAPRAAMPSRVEILIALGRVPLLAALTTRQLADVAERARWAPTGAGAIVITAGDPLDALIVVEDGELALGDRRLTAGDVVDELACVAPVALGHDLRAVRAARLIRLERVDFEELVDDVPGLAAAVCRALGERARRAEDGSYRSPLASIVR